MSGPSAPPAPLEEDTAAPEDGGPVSLTQEKAPPGEDEEAAWRRRFIGKTIDDRYAVQRVLGEGGMGVVYLCRHTIIDKRVAMKVLRGDLASDQDVAERFLNEARSASSIGNPHIIDISDFGRLADGATYFIMEYLEGQPLSSVLARHEQLPPARLVHIARQLTQGLAAAHAAGVVHRDLKPDNVFLIRRGNQEDFVKILDFGIAKLTSSGSKPTRAGQVFGTPHYMSPEQASGTAVDHRSDIYAFGVMLYEMATGRLPFDADNFMAVLTQHMYREPRRFRELPDLRVPVPPQLEAIVFQCLAKAPDERYQSMAELDEDLARFSGGLEVRAVSPTTRLRSSAQSRWVTSILWTAAAALVLVLGGLFVLDRSEPRATFEPPDAASPEAPPAGAPEAIAARPTVTLNVTPPEARLFRDGVDLGRSPVVLEVSETPFRVEARLDGYATQSILVDGQEPRLSIHLTPPAESPAPQADETPAPANKAPTAPKKSAPAATPTAPAKSTTPKSSATPTAPAPSPAPKKNSSSSEIVNPWD